jgi:hypothetical protein
MKGKDIINGLEKNISMLENIEANVDKVILATNVVNIASTEVMEIHSRALAAHCECLTMSSENDSRLFRNIPVYYTDSDFLSVMVKWGLIDEKREPLI